MEDKKNINERNNLELPSIKRETQKRTPDGCVIEAEGIIVTGKTLEEVKKFYDEIKNKEKIFSFSKK